MLAGSIARRRLAIIRADGVNPPISDVDPDRVLGDAVDRVERLRVGAADAPELVERGAEAVSPMGESAHSGFAWS